MKAEWTNKDVLTQSETTGKSILVIDTPKNCSECKLMYLQGIGEGICNAVDWEERPSWCPLKPMPEKFTTSEPYICNYNDWQNGWNDCLEEIQK